MQTKTPIVQNHKKIEWHNSCEEKSYNVQTALFALGRSMSHANQTNNDQANQKSQIKNNPKK